MKDTPRHPAKFNDAILKVIAEALPADKFRIVLDPFAGTGRIHELPNDTIGMELEPEWAAMHERTLSGDCIGLMRLERDGAYDAIATSPCYGNRMADDHTPSVEDTSTRNTYRHALGRPLTDGTAANMQWGPEYRSFHEAAWREAARILRTGGRFVLNIKDHIREGAVIPVSGWHATILCRLGLRLVEIHPIAAKGNRQGANGEKRVDVEWVLVFVKDPPVVTQPTLLDGPDDVAALRAERDAYLEDRTALALLVNDMRAQLESALDEVTSLKAKQIMAPLVQDEASYARSSDPSTSKKAAKSTAESWRTNTQNVSVLIAYFHAEAQGRDGLTAEEACRITGMRDLPDCCWWHRVSDNKKLGTIVPTGAERAGRSKHDREVLRITSYGMDLASRHIENGGASVTSWGRR